jgi:hypothetical protein
LIRAPATATVGELAVDSHRWYGADAETFGSACYGRILHIQNGDLARRAREALDQFDGVGVEDALSPLGVKIQHLPLSPERVWRLIRQSS